MTTMSERPGDPCDAPRAVKGRAGVRGYSLESAPIEIIGRLTTASNMTFLCRLETTGAQIRCVYKPELGERPLWDFPDGTLAAREYASYLISEALGWSLIPRTVLRDGPHGRGMVQLWIESAPSDAPDAPDAPDSGRSVVGDAPVELVDLFPAESVPKPYLPVFAGEDMTGRRVVLAHADDARLERMAVLDVVLNNPDRKGGHVLSGPDGALYGIDHGICLHADPKLRTILWGWAGRSIRPEWLADLRRLAAALDGDEDDLARSLDGLLTADEVEALRTRIHRLIAEGVLPVPSGGHVIPWPPL